MTSMGSGVGGRHNIDRAFPELLQEMRVAQTGGQIFFAFLFSVAFTPAFSKFDEGQRTLYQWDLAVVVLSMALLVSPVAVHRALFGLRARGWVLRAAHFTTILGLALLALGIVLGIRLIAGVVSPSGPTALTVACTASLLACWCGLPLALRRLVQMEQNQGGLPVGADERTLRSVGPSLPVRDEEDSAESVGGVRFPNG